MNIQQVKQIFGARFKPRIFSIRNSSFNHTGSGLFPDRGIFVFSGSLACFGADFGIRCFRQSLGFLPVNTEILAPGMWAEQNMSRIQNLDLL